jgi:hypothetical protein
MVHWVFPEHERDWLLFICWCFNCSYVNKNEQIPHKRFSVYSGFCFGWVALWCIGNFWNLVLNIFSQTRDKLQHNFRVMNWSVSQASIQSLREKLQLSGPSNRRLPAKLVPTFADRGCRVVSATDPHSRILGFLDRSRYYFFQVAPQLYSQGWVDPIPDPLLLRKTGSAGHRTRDLWICSQELWPLDHRGG